jgi:hypothetical protein
VAVKAGDNLDEFGVTAEGFEYLRHSVARQPNNIWGYLQVNSAKTLGPNHWHRDDPNTVFSSDNILDNWGGAGYPPAPLGYLREMTGAGDRLGH